MGWNDFIIKHKKTNFDHSNDGFLITEWLKDNEVTICPTKAAYDLDHLSFPLSNEGTALDSQAESAFNSTKEY